MNDIQNPSVEQIRSLPGVFDPTRFSTQDAYGQPLESAPRTNPRSVTASANVNPLDDLVRVDSTSGSVTMTLETAVGCDGRRHVFKKTVAANSMIVAASGSETIDGAASVTRTGQYDVISVISNGTNWDLEYAGPGIGGTGGGTVISSGSLAAAATTPVTGIAATYNYLILTLSGASCDTATRMPIIQLSTDGGSTYDTTAGNYEGVFYESNGGAVAITTLASITEELNVSAATTWEITVRLDNYQGTGGRASYWATFRNSGGQQGWTQGIYIGSTSAIDAVRFAWNGTGSSDAGTYTVKGY